MQSFGYWVVFGTVFFALCVREGKRTTSDKPVSRWLRRLYQFCVSRMGDKDEEGKS